MGYRSSDDGGGKERTWVVAGFAMIFRCVTGVNQYLAYMLFPPVLLYITVLCRFVEVLPSIPSPFAVFASFTKSVMSSAVRADTVGCGR